MILLNNFYTLSIAHSISGSIAASITFDKSHAIFKGHFPEVPIVPGVCMMQMMREVMEQEIGKRLYVTTADTLKFLAVINPLVNPTVELAINYTEEADEYAINGSLFNEGVIFFKSKAQLKPR